MFKKLGLCWCKMAEKTQVKDSDNVKFYLRGVSDKNTCRMY